MVRPYKLGIPEGKRREKIKESKAMNDMTLNDMLQWISIIVILIIVIVTIVIKTIRFHRSIKKGENIDCGCGGCTACPKYKEKQKRKGCDNNDK